MEFLLRLKKIRRLYRWMLGAFVGKKELGGFGENSVVECPTYIENPQSVFLAENARIRRNVTIINSPAEKVTIKKYSVIAAGVTIITNSHRSTVGIPQFLLGASHINDKSADVVIEEDVWIGANATILAGVTIGRGAIVGACAVVTKDVPPYTLVAGFPARVVKKNFSGDDAIRHEALLYPKEERLSQEYLRDLLDMEYKDMKVYGCNSQLTNVEQQKIESIKRHLNFVNHINVKGK